MTGTDGFGCSWRFFKTGLGRPAARQELDGLDVTGRQTLLEAMKLYSRGRALPRQVKPLGDGLSEIRVNVGNNHYRTIFYHPMGHIAVALVIFYKSTNQTPKDLLDLAKERRGQWESSD